METKNVSKNGKKSKNEILIKYKINKDDYKIRIFGYSFYKKNKNKCKFIYEGEEYPLTDEFYLNDKNKLKDILEIKLTGIKNITNMNYLFYCCTSLISIPDISEWDISNVTEICFSFHCCTSLIPFPDISKWNTSNVTDMNGIFSG